jgi:hypothetical protein
LVEGQKAVYRTGMALAEIGDSKLYREGFGTFEAYCKARWDMGRVHAFRMIESAKVHSDLLPVGNVPSNKLQARPLTQLPTAREK